MTPAIRPQPEEASDTQPTPSAAHPGAQIAAGVIGSVAVTVAAKELGGSPWGTLVVALVGATVPVLISYTPRHRHLRLGLVAILVAVAFALTYGGFALYDAAADKQTFPRPGPTPTPTASPTPDGGALARVTPSSLPCTPEQCGQVEIANVGGAALDVGEIRFADGEAAGFTREDTCDGVTIEPGDRCTFGVRFAPPSEAGTRSAVLLVSTSDGRVGRVQLEGSGGEPADFRFDGPVTCELGVGTTATLHFTVTGPQGSSPTVDTSVSEPSPQPANEPIDLPVDLGEPPPVTVALLIDPGQEFPDNPDNNAEQAPCG